LHAGGVVGTDHRGPRLTTPLDLIGATRMHVGGLAMNEMPAILERGEGVFTPAQMSKLAPAQSTNNSKATTNNNSVNVSVNVPPSMDRASAQQLASMVGAKTQKAMRSIL
jgi:hypothetical protein